MRSESALAGLHTVTKSYPDFAQQIFWTYKVRIAIYQKLILHQISLLQHPCSRNPVIVKNSYGFQQIFSINKRVMCQIGFVCLFSFLLLFSGFSKIQWWC